LQDKQNTFLINSFFHVISNIIRYYRSLKENGVPDPLWQIQDLFEDILNVDLDNRSVPVLFKKETPDRKSTIQMGKTIFSGCTAARMGMIGIIRLVPLSEPKVSL